MLAWLHRALFRIHGSFQRRRLSDDYSAELETHLALLTEQNLRRGMPLMEARRAARIKFGGLTQMKEDQLERRAVPHLDTVVQDLRHAIRLLRKSPGFTAIAVFTLALGIGLSTTVFTVYDSVAVRLLPVKDAGSLVRLMRWYQDGSQDDQFTVREFEYLRNQAKSFSAVIAASTPVKVPGQDHAGDDADLIQVEIVSADYFSILGIGAQPGRTFLKEDRGAIEARPVAVVSNRFWRRRFASDPALPGRSFLINGTAFVLIGVAPESFPGTGAPPMTPDVWIPLTFADQVVGQGAAGQDLRVQILCRRNFGLTSKQVGGELALLGNTLQSTESDRTKKLLRLGTKPATFFDTTGGGFEVFLWVVGVLMIAVVSVLLIGCVNLVNLLLARAVTRRREIAVRCALGAGRGRIVRQLCTESVLMGFLGGLVGLLFSVALCRFLTATLATRLAQLGLGAEYLFVDLSPNYAVFLYAFAISVVTGLLVGLGPARQATRGDVATAIKLETAGATGGHGRFRTALIAVQVAVCLTLLTAAGLLGRGVNAASHADPGFETRHLYMIAFPNTPIGGKQDQRDRRLEEIVRRLESMPQIQSVSMAARPPLLGHGTSNFQPIGSRIDMRSREASSLFNFVSPSYFQTLGVPIMRGRVFTPREVEQDAPVIVISDQTARRYWPGEEPLGKRISVWKGLGDRKIAGRTFTVIGIAKSVRSTNLSKIDPAYIYFPASAREAGGLLLRSWAAPSMVAAATRGAVSGIDRALADQLLLLNVENGPVELQRLMTQAPAMVAAALGCLGLLLASVGIYGVVAHLVGQRTQEIGVRMALGADRGAVLALVFRQALKPLLWGVPAGLIGSALVSISLGKLMVSTESPDLLYGVSPWSPVSFAGVLLLLMLVVWAASWLPARRAMRIDPSEALRYG